MRYPLEPLAQHLGIALGQRQPNWPGQHHDHDGPIGWQQLAEQLDLTPRQLRRRREAGGLTFWDADNICTRLGIWPGDIWPDWNDQHHYGDPGAA